MNVNPNEAFALVDPIATVTPLSFDKSVAADSVYCAESPSLWIRLEGVSQRARTYTFSLHTTTLVLYIHAHHIATHVLHPDRPSF
jgi:hypothetical protein